MPSDKSIFTKSENWDMMFKDKKVGDQWVLENGEIFVWDGQWWIRLGMDDENSNG
jgi:hypothetical protein